jgi:hypothetical protein
VADALVEQDLVEVGATDGTGLAEDVALVLARVDGLGSQAAVVRPATERQIGGAARRVVAVVDGELRRARIAANAGGQPK